MRRLRRLKLGLSLAEIREPGFIDRSCIYGPAMREAQLLEATGDLIAKSRNACPVSLKGRKRIQYKTIGNVVIDFQLLLTAEVVVDAERTLILTLIGNRTSTISIRAQIGKRHQRGKQVSRRRIKARRRNVVVRKNDRVRR